MSARTCASCKQSASSLDLAGRCRACSDLATPVVEPAFSVGSEHGPGASWELQRERLRTLTQEVEDVSRLFDFEGDEQQDDPLAGLQVGGCLLLERIGSGGMGTVYRAEQLSLGRHVAVKVIHAEHSSNLRFIRRLHAEARVIAALNHPNILQVHDVGSSGNIHYIVMELVEGPSLGDLVFRGVFEDHERCRHILRQTLLGLGHAHERGVVHRDLKPDNILLAEGSRVKLADFGLAKQMDADQHLTASGIVLGTPLYMSPEAAHGYALDPRSDIYSLGATFYHVLSGAPPFSGETAMAILHRHIHESLTPLEQVNPAIDPVLARILPRMLAKSPEDRYPSCAEILAALDACVPVVTLPPPATAPPPALEARTVPHAPPPATAPPPALEARTVPHAPPPALEARTVPHAPPPATAPPPALEARTVPHAPPPVTAPPPALEARTVPHAPPPEPGTAALPPGSETIREPLAQPGSTRADAGPPPQQPSIATQPLASVGARAGHRRTLAALALGFVLLCGSVLALTPARRALRSMGPGLIGLLRSSANLEPPVQATPAVLAQEATLALPGGEPEAAGAIEPPPDAGVQQQQPLAPEASGPSADAATLAVAGASPAQTPTGSVPPPAAPAGRGAGSVPPAAPAGRDAGTEADEDADELGEAQAGPEPDEDEASGQEKGTLEERLKVRSVRFLDLLVSRQHGSLAYYFPPAKECRFPKDPSSKRIDKALGKLLKLPKDARVSGYRIEKVHAKEGSSKGTLDVVLDVVGQGRPHRVSVPWTLSCGKWRVDAPPLYKGKFLFIRY